MRVKARNLFNNLKGMCWYLQKHAQYLIFIGVDENNLNDFISSDQTTERLYLHPECRVSLMGER